MSNSLRSLSTTGLTPKTQVQYWTDALTELCGKFDVDPLGASSLEGHINYTTVSRLKLCQIEASQHRIALPNSRVRKAEHPFVKVLFQTYGISHFEQDGRRIELMPGDCLAYDVSGPHTIISPSLTRHEVVIVPTELLEERGFHSAKMPVCKVSARTGTGRIVHDFVHAAFGEAPRLSPSTATSLADTLIDLLLLPLREVGTMSDRSGPAALYLKAQAFIRDHLRDPELSIEQISAALGCSKRYLHMIFSDRGMTVSDYIWQARLQNCRQELEDAQGKTITDVAFSWGFSSSSHFSRVFRRYFGVSPSSILKVQHQHHLAPDALMKQSVRTFRFPSA
ncbi:helix-turn-helix domain-containing protein [Bradyrhizobium sp. WD16]|uniref:helix-turn-helix domain-containing protein n=1 Tax=Bradyrhizobium sp. WD16 TaxID=1521768 RepID=UPI0020A35C1E|nr:helix-turn-helix domain-containing protein [Bradyrhizobium sp. WD16]UTD26266.1 transcriptional regulator [Bradyrhizobium sp. WD16]